MKSGTLADIISQQLEQIRYMQFKSPWLYVLEKPY